MVKTINPIFTINLASKSKHESKSTGNKISRKCYAVVKVIDGEFKAIINIDCKPIHLRKGDKTINEQFILPFTKKSLDLKNKLYVFLKEKDKYGHCICIIRDNNTARLHPGVSTQYNTICDNLLIAGYIICKNNEMYFEYEDLIKYHYLSESNICDINIDDNKPLFDK